MWSGDLASHPFAVSYRYASSMLQWPTPSQHEAVMPSIEEIHQSFELARQQSPPAVQTEFGHAAVSAVHDRLAQDTAQSPTSDQSALPPNEAEKQQEQSDDPFLSCDKVASPSAAAHGDMTLDESSSDKTSHTGSGATWRPGDLSLLEGHFRHSWASAMSAARAAQKPISFFWQGSEREHLSSNAQPDDSAAPSPQEDYTPFPVIATEPFSRAWRDTHQQGASLAAHLLSTVMAARTKTHDYAVNVLSSLQTAADHCSSSTSSIVQASMTSQVI